MKYVLICSSRKAKENLFFKGLNLIEGEKTLYGKRAQFKVRKLRPTEICNAWLKFLRMLLLREIWEEESGRNCVVSFEAVDLWWW